MEEVVTEITIEAEPEKVWALIVDIPKWSEWSPIINRSAGSGELGAQLSITMCSKTEGLDGPKYRPKIIEIDPARRLRWRAKMLAEFIFTNDKILELEKTNSGTKLIHKELFGGFMGKRMCSGKMKENVAKMLDRMNQALKQTAE